MTVAVSNTNLNDSFNTWKIEYKSRRYHDE